MDCLFIFLSGTDRFYILSYCSLHVSFCLLFAWGCLCACFFSVFCLFSFVLLCFCLVFFVVFVFLCVFFFFLVVLDKYYSPQHQNPLADKMQTGGLKLSILNSLLFSSTRFLNVVSSQTRLSEQQQTERSKLSLQFCKPPPPPPPLHTHTQTLNAAQTVCYSLSKYEAEITRFVLKSVCRDPVLLSTANPRVLGQI